MSPLAQILHQEIHETGPISFHRFMELALYYPKLGYYEGKSPRVGRVGDFYTSVSTGQVFGQLLGIQFADWLEQFTDCSVKLVEAGAHQGDLAKDILQWLQQARPNLLERLEYWILEPSPDRRAWQQKVLQPVIDKIHWLDSVDHLAEGGICGIIFSNEFLDAFPVHRLGWDAASQNWFEWGVKADQQSFAWIRLPPLSNSLIQTLALAGLECPAGLRSVLPDGFTIELNPAAGRWWSVAASKLCQGRLLTFDYGMRAVDWFSPTRPEGTLRAYRRHRLCKNLLDHPGEQDLTAHINFSHLQNLGERQGLITETFETQERFLTGVFQRAWQAGTSFLRHGSSWKRSFQTLTHPDHLGRSFHVLVQKTPG
jgi:SAM-dependent MidA family methyltransferase